MHHVFVAGTFDGLHKGHEAMIRRAFDEGERVTIGLTTDGFVKKYKASKIQGVKISDEAAKSNPSEKQNTSYHRPDTRYRNPSSISFYHQRLRALKDWLRKECLIARATIVPIDDPYKPASTIDGVEAIVVSTETKRRGEEINAKRIKAGLSPFILLEVPIVSAEDGHPISSTRVRSGVIDGTGRLVMPETLRSELGKPLGRIVPEAVFDTMVSGQKEKIIVTVGDVTTERFLKAGMKPRLMIIDHRVGRKSFTASQPEKASPFQAGIKSGPGYISHEALQAIAAFFHTNQSPRVFVIDGEEDLLVLPVIRYAPLGTYIYYGQPYQGLVEIVVTQKVKQHAIQVMDKFYSTPG